MIFLETLLEVSFYSSHSFIYELSSFTIDPEILAKVLKEEYQVLNNYEFYVSELTSHRFFSGFAPVQIYVCVFYLKNGHRSV